MLKYEKYPEDAGVSSNAVSLLLSEMKKRHLEPHAVIILKHGRAACKMEWTPYRADTPHTLFSLSKSFCSCAAGFAVAEGKMRFDTPILEILPDKAPESPSEALKKVTVGDLLCMGSGIDPKSDMGNDKSPDWAKAFLSHEVLYPARTHFHYNTMGTYMVSAAVQRVTGQTCRDYLMPRLFDKIGIRRPQWDCCPMGINEGGFGLHLSCEDIAKFGQLLLQDGMWEGERVLPEGWVSLATSFKIDNSNGKPDPLNEWAQGYGYQFWCTRGGRYRGDGMFGQICMVDEKNEMVIAVTAGIPDMAGELESIRLFFETSGQPAANDAEKQALRERIAALGYPFPKDDGTGEVPEGSYLGPEGRFLRLDRFEDGSLCVHYKEKGADTPVFSCMLSRGDTHRGELNPNFPGERPQPTLGAYGFCGGVLVSAVRAPLAPYTFLLRCEREGDGLKVVIAGAGSDCGEYIFTRAL